MASAIEARIMSITNDEVYRIIGNTNRGKLLKVIFNYSKIGGLIDFEVTLPANTEAPLFSGMRFDFYYRDDIFLNNRKIFTGWSDENPLKDSNENSLTVKGFGYYNKLKNKLLTATYTDKTINYILKDLSLSDLDISLSDDIISDSFTFDIAFKEKNYAQVLDLLLKIANTNYSTEQYVYGVDEERQLYFKKFISSGTTVRQKYYEGYDFQNPELTLNSDIINKVIIYRIKSADSKDTEFVANYIDSVSFVENGEHSKKIIVPDYTDNNAIVRLTNAILKQRANPTVNVKLKDFYRRDCAILENNVYYEDSNGSNIILVNDGTGEKELYYRTSELNEYYFERILQPDYYGLLTKPKEKLFIINECNNLSEWNLTHLSNSTVELDSSKVLTRRNSLKWSRDVSQPAGDYIEYTLDNILAGIIELKIYIYFETAMPDVSIKFYDSYTNYVEIVSDKTNNALLNNWLQLTAVVSANNTPGNIFSPADNFNLSILHNSVYSALGLNTNGHEEILKLNISVFAYYLAVEKDSSLFNLTVNTRGEDKLLIMDHYSIPLICNLTKIKIELGAGTASANTFYIDRIECKNISWDYYRLALAKAKYTIDKDYILSNLEFGEVKPTLVDEIKDKLEKGDIAFDIYAKT